MSCQGQELNLVNVVSTILVQLPGTVSLPSDLHDLTDIKTFKNGPRVYFLSVLIRDFLRRSWTFRSLAPYKSCNVLYCIVLYCIVLYCIVLYCIVLYCIVLYCTVLYGMVFTVCVM